MSEGGPREAEAGLDAKPNRCFDSRWRGYEVAWVFYNNMSMWDDARRFKRLLARSA